MMLTDREWGMLIQIVQREVNELAEQKYSDGLNWGTGSFHHSAAIKRLKTRRELLLKLREQRKERSDGGRKPK